MDHKTGICHLAVVPLRAEPNHKAELTSQIIFGETFKILDETPDWTKIKTSLDDYEAWVDSKQIIYIEPSLYEPLLKPQFLSREVITMALKLPNRDQLYLPIGSALPFFEDGKCTINNDLYQIVSNDTLIPNREDFLSDVEETAKRFINAPYLWGGRTHFGIDCSGFSQIVFKLLGISIKRDAWQQAEQGRVVDFLTEAKTGDLAFFDNEDGKITHVGIMLNNSQIIHASGKVKIDIIDNQGIFSAQFKRYTHKLRIIKRFAES